MNRWDSLYIYYLSGTGNARASSEWIADEASKTGMKTSVQQDDFFYPKHILPNINVITADCV